MSTMRRLDPGSTIHIRTGVLQGIGPQGPRGATGPQGERGESGPQGVPGPTGYVNEATTEAKGSGSVAHGVASIASFENLIRDDASVFSSASTLSLTTGGWQGTAYINFVRRSGVNGTGTRKVEIVLGGQVISSLALAAATDVDSDVTVPFVAKVSSGQSLQVRIYQSDGASLAYNSRLCVSRIGAGVQGPMGPEGPVGPPGPEGPVGPAGPTGTLSPNTTFADIGGT